VTNLTKHELAEVDYKAGMTYKELSEKYGVSENTIGSWKRKYNWTRPAKTAPIGNQNAKGNKGNRKPIPAPKGNQYARKHGLFSRYIPQETLDIMNILDDADMSMADILWIQIKLQYSAIIRGQDIMFVVDRDDTTRAITKIHESDNGNDTTIEVQHAWDKHANFLSAQSKAQAELRNLIKQFNDLAHENDERRLKLEQMQLNIDKTKAEIENIAGGGNGDQTIIITNEDEMRRILDERSKDN
jgi:uncharacterized protein YjcR